MLIQPIDIFVYAWLLTAVLSAAYVAWDQFRGNPEPAVMKWGFVLISLYMGPIGLLLYVMADKEPKPGEHEEFVKPLWKQGVGSTVHCVAGDATGIIAAAAITALAGFPMWTDVMVEYLTGFLFGLLIFQSLFMRKMMGGTYLQNLRRSFLPEFISMNCMMAGMAPVMIYLMMGRDMRAMQPSEPLFWVVMSLGIVVGFLVAYPVNVWLVAHGMKHGLMTVRSSSAAASPSTLQATSHDAPHKSPMAMGGKGGAARQAQAPQQHAGHAMGRTSGRSEHSMTPTVTRPQLVAVTAFTVLLLVGASTLPSAFYNLRLSARQMGGAIMPPGMIMTQETSADTMLDMAAVDPRQVSARYTLSTPGAQVLEPRLEAGVKVFELTTSVIQWQILPDVFVDAYAFNGQVPGPTLRFRQGDHVRIHVTNHLPATTTVHWHGLILPNVMDGPAHVTQAPIEQGNDYTYEFTAVQSGTYLYHSHDHVDRQQSLGLYGALLIDPAAPADEMKADHEYTIQLQEWLVRDGLTYPAMPMEGGMPNYFTINGRAYPVTDTIHMKVGETLKVRFIGSSNGFIHPMHIHGGPFTVIARDGETLAPAARYQADTLNIGPGQRYDVMWPARKPGKWLIHCHIAHHTANNNMESQGGGGLMMVIDVAGDPAT
jgi:FtsP/CotA-like multicopper oxidase with cupredoxin domain